MTSLPIQFFESMFDLLGVNTCPLTTVKQRERLLYALGAGVTDGAFGWRSRGHEAREFVET
jgi:hypothetical protein